MGAARKRLVYLLPHLRPVWRALGRLVHGRLTYSAHGFGLGLGRRLLDTAHNYLAAAGALQVLGWRLDHRATPRLGLFLKPATIAIPGAGLANAVLERVLHFDKGVW